MKKITLLCLAFVAFVFSFQANAQCDYTLEMSDAWGDGWNGVSSMDVYVGGALAFTAQAADAGTPGVPSVENLPFTVNDGDDIYTVFNPLATQGADDWASEASYRILDNFGSLVASGDSLNDIPTGTVTVVCQTSPPVAPNCADTPTPADNAVDVVMTGDTVTISWVPSVIGDPADEYDVYWGNATGTTALIGTTPATSVDITGLLNATEYFWMIVPKNVGGEATGCMEWSFTTEAPPPAPANDNCANAIATATGMTYDYDTTTATLDDATACGSPAFSPNVWYTYTGSGSPEIVTLSTCNDTGATPGSATYDTKLFVFSGACGALVCVANNDDNTTSCAGFSSILEFTSDGTTTYYISANGYNTDTGTQVSQGAAVMSVDAAPITVPAPANDLCGDAEALTIGIAATGTTVGATASIANPSCDLFGTISDVWYSFNGPATGVVTLTTTIGTSDNAWIAVYDACGGTELGCASGATITGGGDEIPGGKQLELTGLIENTTYIVQVWNDGAAAERRVEGTFDIIVEEGLLSTQDINANGLAFTYYPNPVNDNLALKAQKDIENVTVYNMLGQEVLRATPNAINADVNMSSLQAGAYFVKVTIGNATETVKIIKN